MVGLNLKAGPNRPDLTIIYLHWSEQKRKILACVAELKSHLVRQIQVRWIVVLFQYARRCVGSYAFNVCVGYLGLQSTFC